MYVLHSQHMLTRNKVILQKLRCCWKLHMLTHERLMDYRKKKSSHYSDISWLVSFKSLGKVDDWWHFYLLWFCFCSLFYNGLQRSLASTTLQSSTAWLPTIAFHSQVVMWALKDCSSITNQKEPCKKQKVWDKNFQICNHPLKRCVFGAEHKVDTNSFKKPTTKRK